MVTDNLSENYLKEKKVLIENADTQVFKICR